VQSWRVSGAISTFPCYAFVPCKATLPCLSYPVSFLSCGVTERKELTCHLCAAMFTFPDLFLNVATGSLNCMKKTEWLVGVSVRARPEHAMKGIKWRTSDFELLANYIPRLFAHSVQKWSRRFADIWLCRRLMETGQCHCLCTAPSRRNGGRLCLLSATHIYIYMVDEL